MNHDPRHPRFGVANPEAVSVPFWNEQIRTGRSAWAGGRASMTDPPGPIWTFERLGMTHTRLPDGRVVCIAGEHEDFCYPDFHIYNDVIVFSQAGDWQVYLYPREIFPPTDFHAAVWCEPFIYILGALGYAAERGETMPAYRLDTRTWAIEPLAARGETPPQLHGCFADYLPERGAIRIIGGGHYPRGSQKFVVNRHAWLLNLETMTWHRGEAAPAPEPHPALADVSFLDPIKSFKQASELCDIVRRTTPIGHPLWGRALRPLRANICHALFEVRGESDRFVICDLLWGESRSADSTLPCRFFDGVDRLIEDLTNPASFDACGYPKLD